MRRVFAAMLVVVSGLTVAACVPGTTAGTSRGGAPLAPPVPAVRGSHGDNERLTGIRGDAIAAISGDHTNAFVYYDFVVADKDAVKAAPAKLCASYGKSLKSSYVTEPENHEPGVKVLSVTCSA